MTKKIKNIFYLISFFIFVFFTINFYFSDQNIKSTNKTRAIHFAEIKSKTQNLTLLKNDTSNSIEYRNDIEVYKKEMKKYKFWDLIKR